MASVVTRASASRRTSSRFATGETNEMSTMPSGRAATSSALPLAPVEGGLIFTTTSLPSSAWAALSHTDAPASRKASSRKEASSPAPDSTATSTPTFANAATSAGTSATRRSPARLSPQYANPHPPLRWNVRMCPLHRSGDPSRRHPPGKNPPLDNEPARWPQRARGCRSGTVSISTAPPRVRACATPVPHARAGCAGCRRKGGERIAHRGSCATGRRLRRR